MMHVRLVLSLLALCAGLLGTLSAGAQPSNHVVVAPFEGVVNPPLAEFVDRVITDAEAAGAAAVVLRMDTPGGLDSSMRQINQRILSARVPVIVYVAPPGARAGSAGVYITYAAHVAAMAPNTNIGSATPVAMGDGGEQQMSDEMKAKVINDATAYLRGLAEQRGRNVDWAEQAVREGANITATEAAEMNVVDFVAADLDDVLAQADGMAVQTAGGEVRLETAGAAVEQVDMNLAESLLHLITNPTIAYILLSLGSLGLFLELSNPGAILPGVVGAISLVMAFYGLGTLPVNFAGLALLVLGLLLFAAELFVASGGILTGSAVVAFILGSLLLFNVPEAAPFIEVSLTAILAVSIVLAGFFVWIVVAAVKGNRRKVSTGREALIGQVGYARTPLDPDGMVWVDGELWSATSIDGPVATGESVEVVRMERLHLYVQPSSQRAPEAAEAASAPTVPIASEERSPTAPRARGRNAPGSAAALPSRDA